VSNRFEHIDINNDKIQKIVNCAFEVFSKNDLEKASTNMIVKQAGISRHGNRMIHNLNQTFLFKSFKIDYVVF